MCRRGAAGPSGSSGPRPGKETTPAMRQGMPTGGRRRPTLVLGLLTASLAASWGCGRPATTASTDEATVTGTVTIRGKRATEGTVTFDPSNARRTMVPARTAPIGSDGAYTIRTLVGGNHVEVAIPKLA